MRMRGNGLEATRNQTREGRREVVAASLMNKAQAVGGRFIPDDAKAEMHRKWPSRARQMTEGLR
jgi:hypothetical protein